MIQKKFKRLTCIALIPARSGSERIPKKNWKKLGGHPLIAYTINTALKSRLFKNIIVSTDSKEIANISRYYGASVPFLRPKKYATVASPDIEWVEFTLKKLILNKISSEYFFILRPTSPFRTIKTLKRARKEFLSDETADSLRAVEKCHQHPAKMWIVEKARMHPLLNNPNVDDIPWHSSPYQILPPIYSQNASLEIVLTKIALDGHSISGKQIRPFFSQGFEGYDINCEKDWVYAEYLLKNNKAAIPPINVKPYQ